MAMSLKKIHQVNSTKEYSSKLIRTKIRKTYVIKLVIFGIIAMSLLVFCEKVNAAELFGLVEQSLIIETFEILFAVFTAIVFWLYIAYAIYVVVTKFIE